MFSPLRLISLSGFLLLPLLFCGSLQACPFCSTPSITLTQQLAASDVAVIATPIPGMVAIDVEPETTVFEIVRVIKGAEVRPKQRMTLRNYRRLAVGDLFFIHGPSVDVVISQTPLKVTAESLNYVLALPASTIPTPERLRHFLPYLENANSTIAVDAFSEFAGAEYSDIKAMVKEFPLEKLRTWIRDPATPVNRIALYGMMLGLCGDASDAKYLEQWMMQRPKTKKARVGLDGVISGYLLLTGEGGLERLEAANLGNKSINFTETFAALQSLRFMWSHAPEKIDKSRLRRAMRIVLDRPDFAELAIADLSRWQDWESQTRLMELYGKEEYDRPSVKLAIICFLLAEIDNMPQNAATSPPDHVLKAHACLEKLRERDPKLVTDAIRFMSVPSDPTSKTVK